MNPLREMTDVRQDAGEPRRRWFTAPDLDLIVWEDDDGVRRFQLAYDRARDERIVDWARGRGVLLHRVDTGEVHPLKPKATPILLPDTTPPPADLAARFRAASGEVEAGIREAVGKVLEAIERV